MTIKNAGSFQCSFILFALLFCFCRFPAQAAQPFPAAISQMVADWERAKAYTREYLDAMPEAGLTFKPQAEVRSFAEQMLHIAGANFHLAAAASGKTNPYQGKQLESIEEFRNKAALTKVVMESYDFVINALKSTKEAKLTEKIKVFDFTITREQAFNKAFEHQTHHRGQATIYLRMKGIKPPDEKLF